MLSWATGCSFPCSIQHLAGNAPVAHAVKSRSFLHHFLGLYRSGIAHGRLLGAGGPCTCSPWRRTPISPVEIRRFEAPLFEAPLNARLPFSCRPYLDRSAPFRLCASSRT